MKTIIRHVFTAVLLSLIMSLVMAGVVLAAFPLDDWTAIFERTLYDVPFLVYVLAVPVAIGTVIGIITGLYWRQRLQHIERILNEVATGQKITVDADPEKDLDTIR